MVLTGRRRRRKGFDNSKNSLNHLPAVLSRPPSSSSLAAFDCRLFSLRCDNLLQRVQSQSEKVSLASLEWLGWGYCNITSGTKRETDQACRDGSSREGISSISDRVGHDGDDNHDYDVDGDGGSHDDVDDVDGDDDVDEDGREFHRSPGQQLELDFPLFRVASID